MFHLEVSAISGNFLPKPVQNVNPIEAHNKEYCTLKSKFITSCNKSKDEELFKTSPLILYLSNCFYPLLPDIYYVDNKLFKLIPSNIFS